MQIKKRNLFPDIPLLILCILFILNECLSIYASYALRRQVRNSTNNQYRLSIGLLRLNIFTGSALAENIIYGSTGDNSSSVSAKRISIDNADLYDFFVRHKIEIGNITTIGAVIILKPNKKPEEEDTASGVSFYDIIKSRYSSLHVGSIVINDPNVKYYGNGNDTSLFLSSNKGSIKIDSLVIDSNVYVRLGRNFAAKNVEIHLADITNTIADSLYTLKIPHFYLSYLSNKVRIDSLQLLPNYSKKEFSIKAGKQVDRFTIFVKELSTENADIKNFLERMIVKVDTLNIDSLHLVAYRNKYVKSIPENKLFLQEILKKVRLPLNIHALNLAGSYIEYDELVPPSQAPGKIYFSKVNGKVFDINNLASESSVEMKMKLSAMLFGKSPVKSSINFPMNKNVFYGDGEVRNIPMKQMNSMLESVSNAVITDGIIDTMKFSVIGNKSESGGSFRMLYHDLRVAAKDIAKNDTSNVGLKVKSFIANNFVIKKNNPEKNGKVRVVEMQHTYANDKFMINNLWQTLLNGIKKTIGIPTSK
jgi:hypothetical protein